MKAVVQRVKKANVKVDEKIIGSIESGLLVFLAVNSNDDMSVIEWMCNKLVNLRVFPDVQRKMNKSVLDIDGEILIISNFTLYGDVARGFRPSFIKSAPPEISKPIYYKMIKYMKEKYPIKVEEGEFGAMMDIELINDGPVTVIIDKEKE